MNQLSWFFSINNSHIICRTPSSRGNFGDTGFKSHFLWDSVSRTPCSEHHFLHKTMLTDCEGTTIESSKHPSCSQLKNEESTRDSEQNSKFHFGGFSRQGRSDPNTVALMALVAVDPELFLVRSGLVCLPSQKYDGFCL